jgi:superoxide dismutase
MSLVSNPKYKAGIANRNFSQSVSEGTGVRVPGTGVVNFKELLSLIPAVDNVTSTDLKNAAKYNPTLIDRLMEKYNYANAGALITGRERQEIDADRAKNFDAITTPNPNYTEEEYNSLNMPAGQEFIPFSVDHPMHPKNTFTTLSNAKKSNRKEYQKILDSVLKAYGGFEPYRDALSAYAKTEEGSNFLKMPSSDVQNMPYTVNQNKDTSNDVQNLPYIIDPDRDTSKDVQNLPLIIDPDRNPNNEDTVKLFSTRETGSSETDSLEDTQEKPVDYEGSFPIYKVDSKKAQSFRDAFSAAEDGDVFEWDGKEYRKDYA